MALTAINKEEIVQEWAADNPYLTDELYLDYLGERNGNCSISPVASDNVIATYIDGSKLKEYKFALQVMLPVSTVSDVVNADNMFTMRKWQAWIEDQEKLKNYPDFGELTSDYELSNLNNMPAMVMRLDNGLAKYQFFARLRYVENEE